MSSTKPSPNDEHLHNCSTIGAHALKTTTNARHNDFGHYSRHGRALRASSARHSFARYGSAGCGANHLHTHTHPILAAGSGAAHNNLPPFVTLNYIIKY